MMKHQRPHRNSVERTTAFLADRAAGPHPVPDHICLPASAVPFWNAITSHRLRGEWSEAELLLVAQAARVVEEYAALASSRLTDRARWRAQGVLLAQELRLLRALRVVGWNAARPPALPLVNRDPRDLVA